MLTPDYAPPAPHMSRKVVRAYKRHAKYVGYRAGTTDALKEDVGNNDAIKIIAARTKRARKNEKRARDADASFFGHLVSTECLNGRVRFQSGREIADKIKWFDGGEKFAELDIDPLPIDGELLDFAVYELIR